MNGDARGAVPPPSPERTRSLPHLLLSRLHALAAGRPERAERLRSAVQRLPHDDAALGLGLTRREVTMTPGERRDLNAITGVHIDDDGWFLRHMADSAEFQGLPLVADQFRRIAARLERDVISAASERYSKEPA